MKRYHHSQSSLFLLELLLNVLLFCLLCGCSLLLFAKSHQLSDSATALQQAVRISTSIASLYESGDGSLAPICDAYGLDNKTDSGCTLYLNTAYQPCSRESAHASVQLTHTNDPCILQINVFDDAATCIYSIQSVYHTPLTRSGQKEGTHE